MASTSHSRQIRSSHNPSVIALSSAKAPSTAAAKPRFRSRTGCWTCRKRKVKCDERGRNPESVAYGGLLPTSSGCKRCEDSGRPCHGYGSQAPSGPLITHYPACGFNPKCSLGAIPYYSFSSHAQDNANIPATFPAVMDNVEPDPRYISQSMPWTPPFDQSLTENQAINYGVRMARNPPPCSSPAASSLGAPSLVPIPQSGIQLPSIDLRRFSVPNYPTWQRSPQPRNTCHSYSSGGLPGNTFSMDQASSPFENMEGDAAQLSHVTSSYERSGSNLQVSVVNALSTDAYQDITLHDVSPLYNYDISERDTQSLSFDFIRPHTSSGITFSRENSQSHQNLPEVYGSPIIANPKDLESMKEAGGAASAPLTTCTEASMQVWPDEQNSSFSAHSQLSGSPKCQPSGRFKKTGLADVPLFPSIRAIPYDFHAGYPLQHPNTCSADAVLSSDRCCISSVNQATECPLHYFQIDPGYDCEKEDARALS